MELQFPLSPDLASRVLAQAVLRVHGGALRSLFDADQPRDEHGRWTDGSGSSVEHTNEAIGFKENPWKFARYKSAPDLQRSITDVKGARQIRNQLKEQGRLNPDGRTVSLYHVTIDDDDRLASIEKRGLVPGAEAAAGQDWKAEHSSFATYFHSSREAAEQDMQYGGTAIVEVRIPVTPKNLIRFVPDEDWTDDVTKGVQTLIEGGAVGFIGGVPPSAVRVIKRSGGMRGASFNPDQPRDEHGRWTDGGGAAGRVARADKAFPRAGDTVDGREVPDGPVPNTDSIAASLVEYEVLPGVREVPVSLFGPSKKHYNAREQKRTEELAEQIKQSKTITPLIIGFDEHKDGDAYIIEGSHRIEALKLIGAKTFPALVVVDTEEPELRGAEFNPDQPRDESGKWTGGGSNPIGIESIDRSQYDPREQASLVANARYLKKAAKEMNFPEEKLHVKQYSEKFNVGDREFTEGGHYNPSTGEIVLSADVLASHSPVELKGILAHEVMHHDWHASLDYIEEMPEYAMNWRSLEKTDGVTEYSRAYWKEVERVRESEGIRDPYDPTFMTAVNETLAEISTLEVMKRTGRDLDADAEVSPGWYRLYNAVRETARRVRSGE